MSGYEGTVVLNYKLTRKLGEGGFGTVYLAEQVALGRRAACKILHPQYSRDAGLVDRFFREARAVCEIGHRTIVTIENFGTLPAGEPFYLMEYFAGTSLHELVGTRLLSSAQLVEAFEPIAEALEAAHAKGIVHRDLKPDNIMVRLDGEEVADVRLLDFGIAKLLDSDAGASMTGDTLGTPAFMAPEQALDAKSVDVRADVYSFAATVYAALSGHAPFEGGTTAAILIRVQTDAAPPLYGYRPEVSPQLDEVLRRCLAKARDQRPATIGQAWREIRAATIANQLASVMVAAPASSVAVTEAPDAAPVATSPPTAKASPGARVPASSVGALPSPTPAAAPNTRGRVSELDEPVARSRRVGLVIAAVALAGIAVTIVIVVANRAPEVRPTATHGGFDAAPIAAETPPDAEIVDVSSATASVDDAAAAVAVVPRDAAGPRDVGGVSPPLARLTTAELDARIQRVMAKLRGCADREPFGGVGPRPAQTFAVSFTVLPNGHVQNGVTVTGTRSSVVSKCLSDIVVKLRFSRSSEPTQFTASVVTEKGSGGGGDAIAARCDVASFRRIIDLAAPREADVDSALARLKSCKPTLDAATFEQLQRGLLEKRL